MSSSDPPTDDGPVDRSRSAPDPPHPSVTTSDQADAISTPEDLSAFSVADGVVIYERGNHRAWIQSSASCSVVAMA